MSALSAPRHLRPSRVKESITSLQRRVNQYLAERRFKTVHAIVEENTLTLEGNVSSGYERQVLVLSISRLAGEREVINDIEVYEAVHLPPSRKEIVIQAGVTAQEVAAAIPKPVYGLLALLVLVPAIWSLANREPAENRTEVYPISGKLLVNGRPAEGAMLVLHPQGQKLPAGLVAIATVNPDGTFSVGTYSRDDGAPAGDYVATVQWNRMVDGQAGRNVLPADYSAAGKSPLKISVKKSRSNSLEPMNIALVEQRIR